MSEIFIAFAFLFSSVAYGAVSTPADYSLIGYVPGDFIQSKRAYELAEVSISAGVVQGISKITSAKAKTKAKQKNVILLKNASSGKYDVIYPGFIDLHNHTTQNVLPVWGEARGQFANRFEWRNWKNYNFVNHNSMKPWVEYGAENQVAAFRWSELQAMVLGTVYLQGPSSGVRDFAIHQVEDQSAYLYESEELMKPGVYAPTDIISPDEFRIVWNHVRPKMLELAGGAKNYKEALKKGVTFAEAYKEVLHDYCPGFRKIITDPLDPDQKKILDDKKQVTKACTKKDTPKKLIRFSEFKFSGLAGKILAAGEPGQAIIAHLAEGRRLDPYNGIEFDMIRILGLDKKGVNFVHGVGLDRRDFKHMAKKGMGLIWSPFSNLILYGETVDILSAKKAGVKIGIGSDWTPTGTKSVLEEIKIARQYIRKQGYEEIFSDKDLFEMMTKNNAELILRDESKPEDGIHGIGVLKADAAASLVVLSRSKQNPYTNAVLSEAKDVNLVLVDGKPVYGNVDYLKDFGVKKKQTEALPRYFEGVNLVDFDLLPGVLKQASKSAKTKQVDQLAVFVADHEFDYRDDCKFPIKKAMVHQDSDGASDYVTDLRDRTGLNLDRAHDIIKFLGIQLVSQSWNHSPTKKHGNPNYAMTEYTPLFSCNDPVYQARLESFISDEIDENLENRWELRIETGQNTTYRASGKVKKLAQPQRMAEWYNLPYDESKDY